MRFEGVVVLEGGGGDLCCFLGVLRCLGRLWLVSKGCVGCWMSFKRGFSFRFFMRYRF